MKGFTVVVICSSLAVAFCYPQFFERQSTNPSDDVEEIEVIPYERRSRPIFAVDSTQDILPPDFLSSSYNPFGNASPFDNFMTRLQETLSTLRERMDTLMKRIPVNGTLIDLGNGPIQNKTTSTTKVVDGNLVIVNKTTFSTGSDGNGAVYHFETVEIKPQDTDVEDRIPSENTENTNIPETTVAPEGKTEESNEIPKEKVSFAEWDSSETLTNPDPSMNEIDTENFNEFDNDSVIDPSVEVFHTNEEQDPERVIDLSDDILVNKLVSDQAKGQELVMMDPDVEMIDVGVHKDMRYEDLDKQQKMRTEFLQYQPNVEDILRI